MSKKKESKRKMFNKLKERAKELDCLYRVEEVISHPESNPAEVLNEVIRAIPPGWQYSDKCIARIKYDNSTYCSPGFEETAWALQAGIKVQEKVVGTLEVYYTEEMPGADEGPFLNEERRLINSIAERVGQFILQKELGAGPDKLADTVGASLGWQVILDLLQETDLQLFRRISRKMTNHLYWRGVPEAQKLLEYLLSDDREESEQLDDPNRPHHKKALREFSLVSEEIFKIAGDYLTHAEIHSLIQKWVKEDKSGFLVNTLENPGSSFTDIMEAMQRYYHLESQGIELAPSRELGFRVSLIRRLLTDLPGFISIGKQYIAMADFKDLLQHIIHPADGYGKLGGKSAGLMLASRILRSAAEHNADIGSFKTPKTWYILSDGILSFIRYNNLDDVVEQKYKEIWQVRQEYPYIVQVFKDSQFPPEMLTGLSMALDELGTSPLIVRSSSLLEDRMGTAFAGKYKSLFIANQGSKEERLQALTDAIAEVYASTFGPDPIEYRLERKLIDVHEEMGIMIQEVVGKKIGHYFLPAYAGVAFSQNEFRWSNRIKRDDGLVRLVPGLGTRAVDRLSDDYPVLAAPGQAGLRVNTTIDEKIRYSPKKIDLINLKTNSFESVDIHELLTEWGHSYPQINRIASILSDPGHLRIPIGAGTDFENEFAVVTFEGLFGQTPFLKQIHAVLRTLEQRLDSPVDIEFASDGDNFYLLQCRPQSNSQETIAAAIPRDVPEEKLIFSADRYVSNGLVSDISHIVYVDPLKYGALPDRSSMLAVGRVIGLLNRVLPRRQFILMGPGRWGSRGDIRLGVSVTYSDINNTAMLIEIARKQGNYLPELSFGTHFFQDLVESSIRYLPLYPDEPSIIFNNAFLENSPNIFAELLPEFAFLSDTVRVIDVAQNTNGMYLQVHMNADLDEAIGVLSEATQTAQLSARKDRLYSAKKRSDEFWRWRQGMAEHIAAQLDPEQYGVKGFYLFGSTKNAIAGPGSDIDILIHFQGTENQKQALLTWLDGWSRCLAEISYLQTGIASDGLLDIHIVTDEDIAKRTSYAAKIGAVTDAALPLLMGKKA